jgi:hypothetical protein
MVLPLFASLRVYCGKTFFGYKNMEIKKYWWEDALVEALITRNEDEYASMSDIILLVAKIFHFIYTKTNKKVCFNDDFMELVHLNGKSTLIDLKTISGITARKFTFYQIHDTNIVHYRKDALLKRNVTFHIPSDQFESFQNYLIEKSIKYKQIR